jgi:hypothetical protein
VSWRKGQESACNEYETSVPVSQVGKQWQTSTNDRSQEVLEAEAQKQEALIPITIDFDVPNPNPDLAGIKIKDRFLWNLNGQLPTFYWSLS